MSYTQLKNQKYLVAPITYQVTSEDNVIDVNTAGGASIIYISNIQQSGYILSDKRVYINDVSGNAATNNITVIPLGNSTINGLASLVLSANGISAEIIIADTTRYIANLSTDNGGGGGGSDPFTADFTVSLSGGKTFGKYTNGQVVPALGLTAREVILLAAIEDIAPTYTPCTFGLTKSIATNAEIGTVYGTNNLVATFTQNDAGALTQIRIQKNGINLTVPPPTLGASSPFSKTDSGTYTASVDTFIGFSNYNAGIIKNYTPSGTPDARTPQIRTVNAPQAAENNFGSNSVNIQGFYKYFYGATATNPTTSALVRALPSSHLTNAGSSFSFNTGTVEKIFSIAMPATKTLTSVFDATAGFDITATFALTTFNVNDAGGSPVSYNVYTLTVAVPYGVNHVFNVVTT